MNSFFIISNAKFYMLTNHLVFSLQSARREGQPCNEFTAYVMAHMGKATSDVAFDPAAPPEAYSNLNIHTRVTRYTEIGKALHGDTWDPATTPLSGEAIMRAGGGKKHGRYWLGDSVVGPVRPLYPSFGQGPLTRPHTYFHGPRFQWPACMHSKLFLFHSSVVYVPLFRILTLG